MGEFFRDSVRKTLESKLSERDSIEKELSRGESLSDPQKISELGRKLRTLNRILKPFTEFLALEKQFKEAMELSESDDPEMALLAREEAEKLRKKLLDQRTKVIEELVADEEDAERSKLIMEIRAGTGGEEAGLFARDLFRMYSKFAESKGWKVEILQSSSSEKGGFKEVIFSVTGPGAWRYLKHESGGHRVQRVPETESQGRIHTSAATVAVLPEPEEVEVQINPKELRIETMRASGPGGQHVNKTSSAVRITHLPSGIVVTCQDEKSQHKNRAKAMRVLRLRLFDRERREKQSARAQQRKELIGSGDRNERVRTYNFPQNRVTDHRLKENFSLEQVIEGKLDNLIQKLIDREKEERIKAL